MFEIVRQIFQLVETRPIESAATLMAVIAYARLMLSGPRAD